jgi:hypothetical protein
MGHLSSFLFFSPPFSSSFISMGNQFSSKIKLQEKANKSFSSQQIDSSSNASTFSSNQPKLPIEYLYPSNEAEANRQSGQHYLFKHLFQGNFFAPVDAILNQPGSKTLDVGCGPQASWLTGNLPLFFSFFFFNLLN